MRISDIRYTSLEEVEKMPRFDMSKKPQKVKWFLAPLTWILSYPEDFACKVKIHKEGIKGLKGGYLLICNHNSFIDFKVATKAIFPRMANYVVAIDGFINREKLMRNVGCICKRKFISDVTLIRQLKYSLKKNNYICAIYPEARYSHVGTDSVIPESLGMMIKRFEVPVVTLITKGAHLRQPVWDLNKRKVDVVANMRKILSPEEIKNMSQEQINDLINTEFKYDDYKYQVENNIIIDYEDRAKNINKVLYQCPNCKAEHMMYSEKNKLWCGKCKKVYQMDTLGRMGAVDSVTEFPHIPDWYEWQRTEVKKQISEGTYGIDTMVHIDSLPNATGFYRLGTGRLIHNSDGFTLTMKNENGEFTVHKNVLENYSIHIEYDYFGKGDCISFSTYTDTYYLFPFEKRDIVTKIHFAVEELYKIKYEEMKQNNVKKAKRSTKEESEEV